MPPRYLQLSLMYICGIKANSSFQFSSVHFSRSVVSDSLRPHELQHDRPPCPSPTPRVYSNSCPLSWWCHPAILSSVVPFSSCPQTLPASGSFPMSQLFAWGGQSIGVSGSASVLPMNTQDRSLLRWTGWISLQSKGLSRVFSNMWTYWLGEQVTQRAFQFSWNQDPRCYPDTYCVLTSYQVLLSQSNSLLDSPVQLDSHVQLFATPWTVAHQVALAM